MIKKTILGLMFLLPNFIFSQSADKQYVLNPGGLFFMIFSWIAIILWNIVCFKKILENRD